MNGHLWLSAWLTAATLVCVGCSEEHPVHAPAMSNARPVTVLSLEERDFARQTHLTGAVSLYREEQIGFEVTGRVLSVLDVGREIEGPAFDGTGRRIKAGEPIAKLDATRYRLQVEAVEARLRAGRRALEVVEAERRQAEQTLKRQRRILSGGAGSQQAVDDALGRYESLAARTLQRQAQISEIQEELEQAKENLADTALLAPFSGRVTRIHVSQGAVVEAGAPVVTLSLMDPIQVQVAVSADEERRIQTGDRALLYPKDPLHPDGNPVQVNAIVYEKGAVADPETRTFRIELIVRNERRRIEQLDPTTAGLPLVTDFLPVVRRYRGEEGDLFVPTNSVYRENGKTYVLRLPGVSFHPDARRSAVGKHLPDKIEVSLGDEYMTVIRWNFRSVRANGQLREGDFLVIDPAKEQLAGLAIGRPQWLLRPGDLVPVRFLHHAVPKGLYVPVDAITVIGGKHAVFVLEEQAARVKQVGVHDTYHELRRITGDDIAAGTEVIVGGVHFVSDGQAVRIVGHERLRP